MKRYVLSVDQSTQGTKGLLFDENGALLARADAPHTQHVNEKGWVEHDPVEILQNTLAVVQQVVEKAGIDKADIAAMGISNQRETVLAWDAATGKPVYNAIVWQCARAKELCADFAPHAQAIQSKTGLPLSPYFSAAKLTWILRNVPQAAACAQQGSLRCGTMDSWLVYNLTPPEARAFKTDYSNASRTQLFNIHTLAWDDALCDLYEVPRESLPEVCMSDAVFGHTTLGGFLDTPIPICGVLGDSHAALLGQNCRSKGSIKATYGTGSSVMLHTGETPVQSKGGLVTSLAWGLGGKVEYVLEGNLNYTGAVMTWLKQIGLLTDDAQCATLAQEANPEDTACFVPAFTGLGAPYWNSEATGLLTGITRTTGRAEIVKACVDCIAYQITDLVRLMSVDSGLAVRALRVDGGPTRDAYLMQLQSDLIAADVVVPQLQELSGMGAACAAGFSAGVYNPKTVYASVRHETYAGAMDTARRDTLYARWQKAVQQTLAAT